MNSPQHKLLFSLTPTLYPFMGVNGSPVNNKPKYEMFAEIKLTIGDVSLISSLWDILPLYEWLVQNKERLLTEPFPFEMLPGESIVECRDRLYSKYDFENDREEEEYYKKLAAYFDHHILRVFGARVSYCIGLNKNNVGEISGYYQEKEAEDDTRELKVFEFEMEQFVKDAFAEIEKYYKLWHESFYAKEADAKSMKIRKSN